MCRLFVWLVRWLRLRPRSNIVVVMYTRSGCHLCDEAWKLLVRFRGEFGFQLEKREITQSDQLLLEYGSWVPVVTIDGKVRFRGKINEVLLRRMLNDH